ncbi:MAG: hypothetical protein JSW33_03555 [bacterium]|nr:MAG: hypothetical protein JSW33_03555 [bacterium]
MARDNHSQSYFLPLLLIILGLIFLLRNSGYVDLGELMSRYWPLILIFIGLRILWNRRGTTENEYRLFGVKQLDPDENLSNNIGKGTSIPPSKKSVENIFGDVRLNFDKQVIESFKTSNIFGDIELNFSQAAFQNYSRIGINGVFGDVNIVLPTNIYTEVQLNYIGGSSRIFEEYHSGLFKKITYLSPDKDKVKSTVSLEISIIFGDIRITHPTQS